MVEYNKVNVPLSDTQLNEWKSAVRNHWKWIWKCLIEINCLMNYYWEQDKKQI